MEIYTEDALACNSLERFVPDLERSVPASARSFIDEERAS
jgi:hypothetical protein